MKADSLNPYDGENDSLTEKIIGVFFDVYNELGFGFLESIYSEAMRIALEQAGLQVDAEVPIPVSFRGSTIGVFRADLVVNKTVLLELKTSEQLSKAHESQTLHYLRATQIEVALLMNFGPKPQFRRLVLPNNKKITGTHQQNH